MSCFLRFVHSTVLMVRFPLSLLYPVSLGAAGYVMFLLAFPSTNGSDGQVAVIMT